VNSVKNPIFPAAFFSDPRVLLLASSTALAFVAGDPLLVVRTLFSEVVNPGIIVPIIFSFGFFAVVQHIGFDRHLIAFLMRWSKGRRALAPAATLATGFACNAPVVSQTAVVISLAPVASPLLRTAGVAVAPAAALVLLGSSIGGELLNPGAPEFGTVVQFHVGSETLSRTRAAVNAWPFAVVQFAAAAAFALWRLRREPPSDWTPIADATETFEPRFVLAMAPLVPLILLTVFSPSFGAAQLPSSWLVEQTQASLFEGRFIALAMVVGTAFAMLIAFAYRLPGVVQAPRVFLDGAGNAFRDVCLVIACASCLAAVLKALHFHEWMLPALAQGPAAAYSAVAAATLSFAIVCGSGIAATQALYPLYVAAAPQLDSAVLASVTVCAAAAGRTASPWSAVTTTAARLAGVSPLALTRRTLPAATVGVAAVALYAIYRG
jgi:DcuC family C4-dicarboxylate transporter